MVEHCYLVDGRPSDSFSSPAASPPVTLEGLSPWYAERNARSAAAREAGGHCSGQSALPITEGFSKKNPFG
jgi:hypothetical protein